MPLTDNQKLFLQSYVNCSVDNLNPDQTFTTINLIATTGFTFQLNASLRANLQMSGNVIRFLEELDGAFNECETDQDLIVYRVCNYREMLRYLNQNTYLDLGYMSTSKSVGVTERFYQDPSFGYEPAFIKINISAGKKVLELGDIENFDNDTYEDEVLIKRCAKFDVVSNCMIKRSRLFEIYGREINIPFETIHQLELKFDQYLTF